MFVYIRNSFSTLESALVRRQIGIFSLPKLATMKNSVDNKGQRERKQVKKLK